MILKWHVPFYREIFALPNFLQAPVVTFGCQGIEGVQSAAPAPPNPFIPRLRRFLASENKMHRLNRFVQGKFARPVPEDFRFDSLTALLQTKGIAVTTLDYFDGRADLRYDMNQPVPKSEHNKYGTMIDIGSLEHLFDTAACMENCFRMVRKDGYYLLHTPINGYFGHGLHVFNPQGLIDCFVANGFKIVYLKYSYKGKSVSDPSKHSNVVLWLVGRKEKDIPDFVCPQQTIWATDYYPQTMAEKSAA
jgi:hypothetical protein